MARLPSGKLHCSAYILPLTIDGGASNHSKSKPKLLKEIAISVSDFETIISSIEGQELRSESEHTDAVGIDGTSWTFLRKTGSRTLELRFWTPESRKNSAAYALGQKFLALALLDSGQLPSLSDSNTDIPVIVPSKEFIAPSQSKNRQGVPRISFMPVDELVRLMLLR